MLAVILPTRMAISFPLPGRAYAGRLSINALWICIGPISARAVLLIKAHRYFEFSAASEERDLDMHKTWKKFEEDGIADQGEVLHGAGVSALNIKIFMSPALIFLV